MLETYSNNQTIFHAVDMARGVGERDDLAIPWYEVVLREGSMVKQLEKDINHRLKPLGKHCGIKSVRDVWYKEVNNMLIMKFVTYILGSLILLAALIGYLRMQIQLFWMRKREVALRIVNGVKPADIFVLMMTETLLIIAASVALAMAFSRMLMDYVFQHVTAFTEEMGWEAGNTRFSSFLF